MKNLELQNFGVTEMNAKEMMEVDGGFKIVRMIISTVSFLNNWANGFGASTEIRGHELQDNTKVHH